MTSMLFQQQSEHARRVTVLLDMVITSVMFINRAAPSPE
jgi:hypothetical protein